MHSHILWNTALAQIAALAAAFFMSSIVTCKIDAATMFLKGNCESWGAAYNYPIRWNLSNWCRSFTRLTQNSNINSGHLLGSWAIIMRCCLWLRFCLPCWQHWLIISNYDREVNWHLTSDLWLKPAPCSLFYCLIWSKASKKHFRLRLRLLLRWLSIIMQKLLTFEWWNINI